jgi:hypothetical protein
MSMRRHPELGEEYGSCKLCLRGGQLFTIYGTTAQELAEIIFGDIWPADTDWLEKKVVDANGMTQWVGLNLRVMTRESWTDKYFWLHRDAISYIS